MGCIGCTVCTTSSSNGKVNGCGSKGNCATGGCNRLNTFDWLANLEVFDTDPFDVVEVSFKNGARKGFFKLQDHLRVVTGEMVVVETGNGYDIGTVSLTGDLVRLQMKKKRFKESDVMHHIIRTANHRDLERLQEAREQEFPSMVRARAIARTLGLEMKIGDVEFQGDKRKATFYYTADGRVDFRELIRHYAKEFRVKIEMRQIGARQESARIGGIGSCGRELCCSTWLSDFRSVSTSAARYQNLAINQAKLSGQCGRLKCCLNYELDTYLEALDAFPEQAEKLYTHAGTAVLLKTDIFKRVMYYAYERDNGRGKVYPMSIEKVIEIKTMNSNGEKPADFSDIETALLFQEPEESTIDFADVTGEIELPEETRKRKKRRKGRKKGKGGNTNNQPVSNRGQNKQAGGNTQTNRGKSNGQQRQEGQKDGPGSGHRKKRRNNKSRNPRSNQNRENPPKKD